MVHYSRMCAKQQSLRNFRRKNDIIARLQIMIHAFVVVFIQFGVALRVIFLRAGIFVHRFQRLGRDQLSAADDPLDVRIQPVGFIDRFAATARDISAHVRICAVAQFIAPVCHFIRIE